MKCAKAESYRLKAINNKWDEIEVGLSTVK